MILDTQSLSPQETYHLLTQIIVPRPIAWVLTEQENGKHNLAPFSYFTAVTSNPPVLMISVGDKPGAEQKDTWKNIQRNRSFVIHIAGSDLAEQVTQSSMNLSSEESEVEVCGLKTEAFDDFHLPKVVGPKIAMGCSLYHHLDIGDSNQHVIFGRIETVWIDDKAAHYEGKRLKVDTRVVNPLARLGGDNYLTMGDVLSVPRPK